MNFVQDRVRDFIDQLQPDFPEKVEYWRANFEETCQHCRDQCRGTSELFKDKEESLLSDSLRFLFPGDVDFQEILRCTAAEEYHAFIYGHIQAILFAVHMEESMATISLDPSTLDPQDLAGSTHSDSRETGEPTDAHAEFMTCLTSLRDAALTSSEPFWRTRAGEWVLGPFYRECLTLDPSVTLEFHQICVDAGVDMTKIKTMYDLISLAMSATTNAQKYESFLPRVEQWYTHFGRGTKWWFVPECLYTKDTPGICVPSTFFDDLATCVVNHPLVSRLEGYGLTRDVLRTAVEKCGDAFNRDARHEIEDVFKTLVTPEMVQLMVADIMTGRFGKRSAPVSSKYLSPQEKASRDHLAAKLAKRMANKRAKKAASNVVKEDTRSIDDLVADIEGSGPGSGSTTRPGHGKSKPTKK